MSVASQIMICAPFRRCQAGWNRFKAGAARFRDEKRGSVFPLFAFSIIPLIGASGLAVDATKAFMVKDQLQKSIDAAALAAGNASSVDNMQGDAQQFFDANFHFDSSLATHQAVNIVVDSIEDTIMITASADVPTSFMTVFGMDKISVSADTLVRRQTRGMELVLVMDNTGSMYWSGKIGAMKTAAQDLVDIVYGSEETVEDLYVGLVPYVAFVNVGNQHASWLRSPGAGGRDLSDYAPTTWKGCVMARSGTNDRNDDPPSFSPLDAYYWEDDGFNNWIWNDGSFHINNSHTGARGPNGGCADPILPLQTSKSAAQAAIAQMDYWPFGGTHVNAGLVWGWRVVSPRWRGLWGSPTPAELPLDYDNTQMEKVVVLLTDGNNEYIWRGGQPESDYSAYGYVSDFGYATVSQAEAELNTRTSEVCASMKAQGIIMYTITFGGSPSVAVRTLMQNCATDPNTHYFHAPNNSTLQTIFRAIGQQLSNLRIEK